jgi:Flp pilus assembly pilin Flp
MSSQINRHLVDEKGANQLKYALIAFFVSIAAVTAMYSMRAKMQNWYWEAVNNLAS